MNDLFIHSVRTRVIEGKRKRFIPLDSRRNAGVYWTLEYMCEIRVEFDELRRDKRLDRERWIFDNKLL